MGLGIRTRNDRHQFVPSVAPLVDESGRVRHLLRPVTTQNEVRNPKHLVISHAKTISGSRKMERHIARAAWALPRARRRREYDDAMTDEQKTKSPNPKDWPRE